MSRIFSTGPICLLLRFSRKVERIGLTAENPFECNQESIRLVKNRRNEGGEGFSAEQLNEAQDAVADKAARFISVQNEYNMLNRAVEVDVLPECRRLNIAFLPFFPLASGLLTGKYRKGDLAPPGARFGPGGFSAHLFNDKTLATVEALSENAAQHGQTPLQLAFSWLLRYSEIPSVIAGAMTPDQVRANASAYVGPLSGVQLQEIDRILGSSHAERGVVG